MDTIQLENHESIDPLQSLKDELKEVRDQEKRTADKQTLRLLHTQRRYLEDTIAGCVARRVEATTFNPTAEVIFDMIQCALGRS